MDMSNFNEAMIINCHILLLKTMEKQANKRKQKIIQQSWHFITYSKNILI